MADAAPKFDAFAAWASLTPEVQALVGPAALVLGYAQIAARYVDNHAAIGFEAAELHAAEIIRRAVPTIAVPENTLPPLPDLSPFGIRACGACGCTDDVGCPEGCSWVAPGDLCSTCDARVASLNPPVRPW